MDTKDCKLQSSTSSVILYINKQVMKRLNEIADIENISKPKLLEKMVSNYVPIPAILKEGEFRYVSQTEVKNLYKLKPYSLVVSVFWNSRIGMPFGVWKEWRSGLLTWEEFRRKYIERLMLPDAQNEIKRLRKLKQSQDVYITSWEQDEDHSMRKIFVDLINGKLVWT